MNKNLVFILGLTLAGCAAPYVVDSNISNTAYMRFERHAHDPGLGGHGVHFFYINNPITCNASAGLPDAKNLAVISRGNPLVADYNENGVKVEAKKNFRIVARNIVSLKRCDVVFSFETLPGKEYKVIGSSDMSISSVKSCSVEVYEHDMNSGPDDMRKVTLAEYQECNNSK